MQNPTKSKMNAALSFVAFLLAVVTVSCKKISYENCTSTEVGEITAIDITPCDPDLRASSAACVLKKGGNETITITFTPNEVVTAAKLYAYVIFGFVPVPLPLPDSNACEGHGLTCPLKSGVQVEFVYRIYISPDFPSDALKIKAEIKDQDGKSVICGIVSLKIA